MKYSWGQYLRDQQNIDGCFICRYCGKTRMRLWAYVEHVLIKCPEAEKRRPFKVSPLGAINGATVTYKPNPPTFPFGEARPIRRYNG